MSPDRTRVAVRFRFGARRARFARMIIGPTAVDRSARRQAPHRTRARRASRLVRFDAAAAAAVTE